jgi:hypothetical protein
MSKIDRPAPNRLLTVSEEAGLVLWLDRSVALRLRTTKQMLENECNSILSRRVRLEADVPPQTCGEYWSLRFLQDYPRFAYRTDNPKELAREAAEDRVALTGWFAGLKETIEVNNIEVRDTYNYDETGVRLGIGKKEKVIMEATRGRIKSGTTTTRKSCILGECISTDGDIAPPLLVLKGKTHQIR